MPLQLPTLNIAGLSNEVRHAKSVRYSGKELSSFPTPRHRELAIQRELFKGFEAMFHQKKGLYTETRFFNSNEVQFDTDLILMTTEEFLTLVNYLLERK